MTGKTLAYIESLSISLGGRPLVRNVSFTLRAGECIGFVGESGSGKSLTARSLLGLNPPELTVAACRLSVFDRDLRSGREKDWRAIRGACAGYVLQDALVSLDPLQPVEAEVRDTLDIHRIGPKSGRLAAAHQALAGVGFPDPALRGRQHAFELSGGLRQRALIASALVAQPELLIADEPTTALDVTVQETILQLLEELKAKGTALVLVSHDLAVVSRLADHILVMRAGEVVEQGPTAQILRGPQHDYTRALLAANPAHAPEGARLSPLPPAAITADLPRRGDRADAPALEARGLCKSYRMPDGQSNHAVRDVSFTLTRGSILGLVGESGSGKSTIARLVMAEVAADHGEIRLSGSPWSALSESDRAPLRPAIQLIAQDPLSAFDPRWSVQDLLFEALRLAPGGSADLHARAVALLEAVGLGAAHLPRAPASLSGGQRQRVAIARALATNPEVLVCDEAVSALDVSVQAQVLDLLRDLQQAFGLSVLFISHDLGVVRHLCDEVMVMHQGQIVERGPVGTVFDAPRHPYTRRLIASIPRFSFDPDAAPAPRAAETEL